jgi:hypothetical protein
MKQPYKILFYSLLVLVVISILVLVISVDVFTQSGVRTLGPFTHLSFQQDCYFINKDLQVTEKSTLWVDGYNADDFTGSVSVEDYPIQPDPNLNMGCASLSRKHLKLVVAPNEGQEYRYEIYILKEDSYAMTVDGVHHSSPYIVVIDIIQKDGQILRAVCGASEEQAIENYKLYLEYTK